MEPWYYKHAKSYSQLQELQHIASWLLSKQKVIINARWYYDEQGINNT